MNLKLGIKNVMAWMIIILLGICAIERILNKQYSINNIQQRTIKKQETRNKKQETRNNIYPEVFSKGTPNNS